MAMTTERYHEIGFLSLKNQFLRETNLNRFVKMDGNEIRKRLGHFVKETGVPKEEALEFVKRFIDEIHSMVKQMNDMAQQISFK